MRDRRGVVFGCGLKDKQRPPEEKVSTIAAAVVASVDVASFAVYADKSAALGEDTKVTGGAVGVRTVSSDVFSDGAELAVSEEASAPGALYADAVLLQDCTVGDVYTNKLIAKDKPKHGVVFPFDATAMPALPTAGAVSPGSGAFTVAKKSTVVLAAGAKGAVTVQEKATLRLSGGIYHFGSLKLAPSARLEAAGASEVRIAGRLDAGEDSYLGPASGSGLTAKGLRIEVNGTNGGSKVTSKPAACAFGEESSLRALVLVPNGTVVLGEESSAKGALFGAAVRLDEESTVSFEDGFASAGCPASCDDGDACTADSCQNNACVHAPVANGSACSDGNACTQSDSCQAGVCVGASPVTCTAQDQCHAAGICDPATGTCSNPAKPNGASCDDGNACTQTDTCQAGACVGASPVVCAALDQCHAAGTCDPATGTCTNPAKPDGTSCSDGSACTQTDTCQAGACVGTNPVVCGALDQCHVVGTCDPASGVCSNPPAVDGTTCTDGNACTLTDVCVSGMCSGANPLQCAALDQCHAAGACDPSSGVCSNPAKPNGTSCSDGNACTQTDSCQAGACVGANPVTCTASDPCHNAGTCDPSSGTCSNPAKADGSSCSDGNACTKSDTCQAGACVGASPVVCAALDQCHDPGSCDTATGVCSNPPKANGSACDDGDACTLSDTCQAGTCTGTNPVVCTASDQCHAAGTCNAATGVCSDPAKPNGTACSDGNACTKSDTCQAGACTGASPVQCTALDHCHDAGTCDTATGVCSNPAKADGASCSDGDACTLSDTCQAGTCTGANPVVCTASDQCHAAGTCNAATGVCSNPAKADGSSCSDGNACTKSDTCQAGACVGASPVVCAASDQCHDAGACDTATGVCSNPPKVDGTTCSDNNVCTSGEVCTAGTCGGGSPVPTDDLNPCTVDSCDPLVGVQHAPVPNGTSCSDGNFCNGTESCSNGVCTPGAPPALDDNNPCTIDICNPEKGVGHFPAAPGFPCSDGNLCNGFETCDGNGKCVPGMGPPIDDFNACTIDTCDPVAGIKHRACSKLDRTVVTTLYDANKWLFSGDDPIQTGVAPGAIDPLHMTVLRGKVKTASGEPLAGVTVQIVKQTAAATDFGHTVTAADGFFTMAVNGGAELLVSFSKSGYLDVQRKALVPWQDYASLPDVVMIAADTAFTHVDSGAPSLQVHRGSVVTDARGTRQATLMFLPGTTAQLVFSNGSGQSAQSLTVRTTEFSVGAAGPEALPLQLPPTSAYTYALSLVADEAAAAGATRVDLSPPAVLYLENFLGFKPGTAVPYGFYRKDAGCWKPEKDGRVVKILDVQGGAAVLDTDGDGIADDAATLTALGVDPSELTKLAALYPIGQTLWRAATPHFSGIDLNFPSRCKQPPCDDPPPPNPPPKHEPKCDDNNASTVFCEDQTLAESVAVVGTPFKLTYASDRLPGRAAERTRVLTLTSATVPPGLKQIGFSADIAGQHIAETYSCPAECAPNKTRKFTWDGNDVFGRATQGRQHAVFTVEYVYDSFYDLPPSVAASFALTGTPVPGVPLERALRRKAVLDDYLGGWSATPDGLGGWSLDVHHRYDPSSRVVFEGDGRKRNAEEVAGSIRTVAGGVGCCSLGDGGKATSAFLNRPTGIAVAADGSLFFGDHALHRVRKVDKNGIITTVAGTGVAGFSGDGGAATAAEVVSPFDVALAPDGTLCIADYHDFRVRCIDKDTGVISTLAGTGVAGSSGDGGAATAAQLNYPVAIEYGPDCAWYIGELGRVRRVGPDGIITTVAGGGVNNPPAAGQDVFIGNANGLAFGADGSLYISDSGAFFSYMRVLRLGTDGVVTRFAGTGPAGDTGDGGPAIDAQLYTPGALTVGADGSVYVVVAVTDLGPPVAAGVRRIGPNGIITRLTGVNNPACDQDHYCGEDGPVGAAHPVVPFGIAVGPATELNRGLYITDNSVGRVYRVRLPLPGLSADDILIPSTDGSRVDVFTGGGRHKETRDAALGTKLWSFSYDPDGRLEKVTDASGLVTTIVHDPLGGPLKLIAPFGQQTLFATDGNGLLSGITNPAMESETFTYSGTGLLQSRRSEGKQHQLCV